MKFAELWMIVSMAWRNVWRSKRRSAVVMTAIALGLWAGLFMLAFSWGMYEQRIRQAIRNEISNIQIHTQEYKDDAKVKFYIPDADAKVSDIDANPEVLAVSGRMVVSAMISSTRQSSGVQIYGIDPAMEDSLTAMTEKMVEGDFFAEDRKNQIVMGARLADKLKVKMRSKIVLTFQDKNGDITSGAFRIVGLFKSSNSKYDEMNVFVKRGDMGRLLGDDNMIHEIAILLTDSRLQEEANQRYKAKYSDQGLVVEGWREIMPEMAFAIDSFDQMTQIFMGIIMLALAFGIINTMLMAVLERQREIGMLMAVGMGRVRIFLMIMFETSFLALVGGPIGILISYLSILYFGSHGIDLSAFADGFSDLGFDSMVYTSLDSHYYLEITIQVVVVALVAAIYPAIRALRLDPVEAIRKI